MFANLERGERERGGKRERGRERGGERESKAISNELLSSLNFELSFLSILVQVQHKCIIINPNTNRRDNNANSYMIAAQRV